MALQNPAALQTVTLKDRRTVSLSVCGAPNGRPVLFFHPIQGNRYMPLTMHKAASALNLKIIALDRPGVGLSSPQPGRAVSDYPRDVAEVCELLGLSQFSIMASSAGTMYALACSVAQETKDKIVGKITIIAPWIPHSSRQPGFRGLLALLSTWTPVPLLHAAVGFSNGRIVQQVSSKKKARLTKQHLPQSPQEWCWWCVGLLAHLGAQLTHSAQDATFSCDMQSRSQAVTELMTRSTVEERAAFAADAGNDAIYKAMINEWTPSLGGIIQEMQLCMERSANLHFHYALDVTAPVRVFMGTADAMLSHEHVQHWADQASNIELITVPNGTHDGVMHTHKVAALEALARDLEGSS